MNTTSTCRGFGRTVIAVLCCLAAWSATARADDACANPTPHAEATAGPTPTALPKDWSAGSGIGTVLDEHGNPQLDAEGNPVVNGRMTAPQDQTVTPYNPAKVIVKVGDTLACGVEHATDKDHWTQDDNDGDDCNNNVYGHDIGDDDDDVNYTWSCSGGTFTTTSGASTTWNAPSTAGTYTLTCTLDDTPAAVIDPETGTRDDGAVTRSVEVAVIGGEFNEGNKGLRYYCGEPTDDWNGTVNGPAQPPGTTWTITTSEGMAPYPSDGSGAPHSILKGEQGTTQFRGRYNEWVELTYRNSGVSWTSSKHYGYTVYKPTTLVVDPHKTKTEVLTDEGRQHFGYAFLPSFGVEHQFGDLMSGMPVNEFFGAWQSDYPGENWPVVMPNQSETGDNGLFQDNVSAIFTAPYVPDTQSPGNTLSTVKVKHVTQSIYAGSSTPGRGCLINTHVLQLYIDHAAYE